MEHSLITKKAGRGGGYKMVRVASFTPTKRGSGKRFFTMLKGGDKNKFCEQDEGRVTHLEGVVTESNKKLDKVSKGQYAKEIVKTCC